MNALEEQVTQCPYCGETITLLIDWSQAPGEYIEDCEVCCQPITVRVADPTVSGQVSVAREND